MIHFKAWLFIQTWILVLHGALLLWAAHERNLPAYLLTSFIFGSAAWHAFRVLAAAGNKRQADDLGEE